MISESDIKTSKNFNRLDFIESGLEALSILRGANYIRDYTRVLLGYDFSLSYG